jgi:acyl carrier protein
MTTYTTQLNRLSPDQRRQLAARVSAARQAAGIRLVAYVVIRPGADVEAGSLAGFVGAELPTHMVPSAFVVVDSLPRTSSGKIDRRALPDPFERQTASDAADEPPLTSLENAIAQVWCQVLALPQIGRREDFFADLGGHSLLATRLLAVMRERLGVTVPVRALFEAPTVEGLARAIERLRTAAPEPEVPVVERVPREGRRVRIEPDPRP